MIREQSHQALILFHIHQAIVNHSAELLWLKTVDSVNEAPGGMDTKDHFAISFGGTEVPNKWELFIFGRKAREREEKNCQWLNFSKYISIHL